jgi:hypothetical protein
MLVEPCGGSSEQHRQRGRERGDIHVRERQLRERELLERIHRFELQLDRRGLDLLELEQ